MKRSRIQLSDHFTYGRLLRFTMPSILMMIFTSIYGVVDGFFVSNYVGALPFSALNLAMPFIMILAAIGFMFGSGGTALVSMELGMGHRERACEIFSLIIYTLIILGTILSAIGYIFAEPVLRLLGATDEMLPYAILYTRINMVGQVAFMLQYLFQSFMVTAERPKMGLAVTIAAGVTNMFLDWLFVGILGAGLAGAAWATVASQTVGGLIPLVYFILPNHTKLRIGKTHMDGRALLKVCTNGSSELLSNAASSLVGMLYNHQLLVYAGSDGVAAYGVIMYVNYIFVGIYFGYTVGIAPVIGYHYGARNRDELKNIFRKSMKMILTASVALSVLAKLSTGLLVHIFVSYDAGLTAMTVHGFRIYSTAFLFMGFNIFGSGFFTALNNGLLSAILSFMRTVVLQVGSILVLPLLFGLDGLWSVIVVSDGICLILTSCLLACNRKRYGY
ncbi:MAG: MATE family efflux transporter [Lachnospira sp.]|nr:MATE family efflux transporter [Lachnospira sp.]